MPGPLADQDFVCANNEGGYDVFQAAGSLLEKAIGIDLSQNGQTIKTLPPMTLTELIVSDEGGCLWGPLLYPVTCTLLLCGERVELFTEGPGPLSASAQCG